MATDSVYLIAAGDIAEQNSANTSPQARTARIIDTWVSDGVHDTNKTMVSPLGDVAYDANTTAQLNNNFDPYWGHGSTSGGYTWKNKFSQSGVNMLFPVTGNHEWRNPNVQTFKAWPLDWRNYFNQDGIDRAGAGTSINSPGNYFCWTKSPVSADGNSYWRIIGIDTSVTALGASIPLTSAQRTTFTNFVQNFLRAQMDASMTGGPGGTPQHVVCMWHQPLFTAGGYSPGISSMVPYVNIVQDTKYNGVFRLILNGHDHLYIRYKPLRTSGGTTQVTSPGATLNEKLVNGFVEIVSGGGGGGPDPIKGSLTNVDYIHGDTTGNSPYGILRLDLRKDRVVGEWVEENIGTGTGPGGAGIVRDSFTLGPLASSSDTTPPTAPVLSLVSKTDTVVNLSWTASTDASGILPYQLERKIGAGAYSQIASQTGLTYSNTGLTGSTSYTYRVKATDASTNANFVYSNELAVTTNSTPDTTPPTAPVLSLVSKTDTVVNLSWTASTDASGIDHYELQRDGVQIASQSGLTFSDTGRTAGTTYAYQVRAVDASANTNPSAWSNTLNTTTTSPDLVAPAAPLNLRSTSTTTSSISMAWDASTDPSGIARYELERKTGVGVFAQVASQSGLTFNDTGLVESTTYTYRVRAVDGAPAANTSAWSTTVDVTTATSAGGLTNGFENGLNDGAVITIGNSGYSGNNALDYAPADLTVSTNALFTAATRSAQSHLPATTTTNIKRGFGFNIDSTNNGALAASAVAKFGIPLGTDAYIPIITGYNTRSKVLWRVFVTGEGKVEFRDRHNVIRGTSNTVLPRDFRARIEIAVAISDIGPAQNSAVIKIFRSPTGTVPDETMSLNGYDIGHPRDVVHHILFGQTMVSAVATDVYFDEVSVDWGTSTSQTVLVNDPFTRTSPSSLGIEPVSQVSYVEIDGTWGVENGVTARALTASGGANAAGYGEATVDLGAALTFPYTLECDITLSPTFQRVNAGLCWHSLGSRALGLFFCKVEKTVGNPTGLFIIGKHDPTTTPNVTYGTGATGIAITEGSTYKLSVTVDVADISASLVGTGVNSTVTYTKSPTEQNQFNAAKPLGFRIRYDGATNDEDDLGTRWDNFKVSAGSTGPPPGNLPRIDSFAPLSGPVGTPVTITGQYFTSAVSVKFNNVPADGFTINSDTEIVANVPAGGEGLIEVTNADGPGISSGSFIITTTPLLPIISSFDPSTGPAGTPVSITGQHFTSTSSVTFGGVSASFTVASDTSIVTAVPTGATIGPVLIRVTNQDGYSDSLTTFTVTSSGGGDVTPPTVPTNFVSTGKTSASVDFSWTASTDAVGVDHYEVQRNGATTPVGFPTTTTFTDTGLSPNTTYTYAIRAVDAAGNASAYTSPVISVTTNTGGGGQVSADVSANGSTGTSVSVTKPTGVTTGKVLVASVAIVGADSATASGWTAVPSGAGGVGTGASTKVWQGLFTKTAGASEPTSYTFTGGSGTKSIYAQIASLSVGATIGTPAIVKSSGTGSMDIVGSGGTVTGATATDLILTFNATDWGPRPWGDSGVLLGFMPSESTGGPKIASTPGVNRVANLIGRQIGLSHGGYPQNGNDLIVPATFPEPPGSTTGVTGDYEAGRLSYISWPKQNAWLSTNGTQTPTRDPRLDLGDIANGVHDAKLGGWATKLRAWGQPCYFRLMWEMNGGDPPWAWGHESSKTTAHIAEYATNFKNAWKRIYTIFKGTQSQVNALSPAYTYNGGTAINAENLNFVWNAMPLEASGIPAPYDRDDLWPGAAFVDVSAVEFYIGPKATITNVLTDTNESDNFYITKAVNQGNKLVTPGEAGNRWKNDDAACITRTQSFTTAFNNFPLVRVMCWWEGGDTAVNGQSSFQNKPANLRAAEDAMFDNAIMHPVLNKTLQPQTGIWSIRTEGRVPMGQANVNYGPNMLSGAILSRVGATGSITPADIKGYGYGRFVTTTVVATSGGGPNLNLPTINAQTDTPPGFSPASGPKGTLVTVNGTNLDTVSSVRVNGFTASFTKDPTTPATKLTLNIPDNATSGVISVTNIDGTTSSSDPFIVTNPPVDPGRVGNGVLPTTPQETVKVGATWYDPAVAGTEMGGRVQSACYAGGYIYVVTQGADRLKKLVGGGTITISSLFRINALTYEVDPNWIPTFNLSSTQSGLNLTSVTTDGNTVWVAGNFDSITVNSATYTRSKIVAIDASTGVPTSWNPPIINGGVKGVVYDAGHLYAVGDFTTVGSGSSGGIPAAVIAAYNFDDITTNSTTATDVTNKGHTGTLVRFSTPPNHPTTIPGPTDADLVVHGKALEFTSSEQQQIRIMSTDFDLTSTLTAGAWVYLVDDGLVDRWEVFEKGGAFWLNVRGGPDGVNGAAVKGTVRMGGFTGTGNGTIWNADSPSPISLNAWHHLVMSVTSAGTAKLYIDGTLVKTQAIPASVLTVQVTEPLVIGAKGRERTPVANEAWWNGYLDDVFVRNDIVSDANVPALALDVFGATSGATPRNRAACFSSTTAALESWNPDVSGSTDGVTTFTNTGTGQKQIVMSHESPSTVSASGPYLVSVVQAMGESSPGAVVWGSDENISTGGSSLTDAFTRTSASSLGTATTGQPWTAGTGVWGTNGTKGYLATKTNGSLNEAWVDSITLNHSVSATITTATTASRTRAGLLARGVDADNYLYVELNSVNNTIDLRKKIAGVSTTLASAAYPGGGGGALSVALMQDPIGTVTGSSGSQGIHVVAPATGAYSYQWGTGSTWTGDPIDMDVSDSLRRVAMGGGQGNINNIVKLFNYDTHAQVWSAIANGNTQGVTFYKGYSASPMIYCGFHDNNAETTPGSGLLASPYLLGYYVRNSSGTLQSWHPQFPSGGTGTWGVSSQNCWRTWPDEEAKRIFVLGDFNRVNNSTGGGGSAQNAIRIACFDQNANGTFPETPTDMLKLGATWFVDATTKEAGRPWWMAKYGGYYYVVGNGFDRVRNKAGAEFTCDSLIRFSTSTLDFDQSFTPSMDPAPTSLVIWECAVYGNELIFVGNMTNVMGSARSGIAAINMDTKALSSRFAGWTVSGGTIQSCSLDGDVLYISGTFTSVNDGSGAATRNRAAAINLTTNTLMSWNPNSSVRVRRIKAMDVQGGGGSFLTNTDYNVSLNVSGSSVDVAVTQGATAIANLSYTLSAAESTALSGTYVGIVAQPGASTDEIGGTNGTRWDNFYSTTGGTSGGVGGGACAANNQLQRIALGTTGPSASGGKAVYLYNATGVKQWSGDHLDADADIQSLAFYQGGSTTPMLYVGTGGASFETTPNSNTFTTHSGLARYTVSTGALDTSWMPYFNQGAQADPYDGGTGGVWSIAPLEDLDSLMVGGDFTAVNQTNGTVVAPAPTRISLWVEPLANPSDPKYTYYLTPPYCGGGYQSITVDPNNAGVLWAGSDVGGIRMSTDRGLTWGLFNRGLYDVESKRKVATIVAADAPANTTDTTWVMAGFGQNGNVGTGLSRDGKDWERQGASVNFNMHNGTAIVSKPRTTGALIAMDSTGNGIQYEGSYGDGIYRSTDGGSSATVIAGGAGLYPRCLYLDPADPSKLYVGVYETPEFQGGLYRIDNPQTGTGKTMTRISTGVFSIRNVEDIAFAGTNIYVAAAPTVSPAGTSPGDAGTTLQGDSGFFRTDGSSIWENITNGAVVSGTEWPYSVGAVNEGGSHVVIFGITEGLQVGTTGYYNNLKRSVNAQAAAGSVTWTGVSAAANITDTDNPGNDTFNKQRLGRQNCRPAQIIPDPHTSGAGTRDWYLMCSEGGIFYYSTNGGQSWTQRTIGFTIWSNNSATLDPTRAGWVIGGNQDNDGWYSPDYMNTVVTRAIPTGATSVTTSHDQDCDRTGRYWTVDNDANPANNRGFIGTGIPSGTSLSYTATYQGDMMIALKTGNNSTGNVRLITYRNGASGRGFWYTDTPNSGTSLTAPITGWTQATGTPTDQIAMGLITPNLPLVWPKRNTQSCLYAVIRGSGAGAGYWRSTNYGATWTKMYADTTSNNGPREGFIAAFDQQTVYYTNGLGELWRIQNANGSFSRTQLTNVSNAGALNFDTDGTLYVYCNPVQGVYPKLLRCKNPATTGQLSWVDLGDPLGGLANDDEFQHLLQVNYVLADPSRIWLIVNGASALRGIS